MVTSPGCRGDRRVLLSAITVMIGPSRQTFYKARDGRVSADMALVLTPIIRDSSVRNLSSAGRTRAAASRTAGRLRHRLSGAVPRWAGAVALNITEFQVQAAAAMGPNQSS